jgi:hypothetical protein
MTPSINPDGAALGPCGRSYCRPFGSKLGSKGWVALGIKSDDVAKYCFPKTWPTDRELRARIIGEWLQTEARFLAS